MTNQNWVFLRGLTRGTPHWGNFPEIFQKLNPKALVEFLEIPGNGSLNLEKTPIHPKTVIHFLKERSLFCQNKTPFNICGISLGGMIALKWAELYPEDISSVVTINTSLSQFSPIYRRLLLSNYPRIIQGLMNGDSMTQEKIILEITSNKFSETKKYLPFFAEFSQQHKTSTLNFFKQLLLANNIKIHQHAKVPLKIICSKNDRLVHFSCSELIANALNGDLIIHPSAGHDLPLDEPEWLSQNLNQSFIKN
jgi:pimeloyl-ACP methyl ester carboxylesterase